MWADNAQQLTFNAMGPPASLSLAVASSSPMLLLKEVKGIGSPKATLELVCTRHAPVACP